MEDIIFSGTSNKPSRNIAEVSITLTNQDKDGPHQYKNLDHIEIRRKIEKDKGSKFYINDKEVRAKDTQMLFADLSTGAHSPSIISQGRIGALVTAKPVDRRAILEEAAGIAGLHVRRHEAELRLDAAENNLKRADELKRQQEKQLANLQKQAEEATKYKLISEEIKKIEAGLYYLRLKDIDNEIKLENEINSEAEDEVSGFNIQINDIKNLINNETTKVKPLREKNFENLSKLQRLNLELKSLDEESDRTKKEIENIKNSQKIIEEDIDREKSIIIDAKSNEKRLKEEKSDLIEVDSKYYETEKKSDEDLSQAVEKLNKEQKSVELIIDLISGENLEKNILKLNEIKKQLDIAKNSLEQQKLDEVASIIEVSKTNLDEIINSFNDSESNNKVSEIESKNENIKKFQEEYAKNYSKNQSIKNESIKRRERINAIENEIGSWINLLSNSEKMVGELNTRKSKLSEKFDKLETEPQTQAEKKGQISENLRTSEVEKEKDEVTINEIDKKISSLRADLSSTQEKMIQIRERRASSSATIDGLKQRRDDLLERIVTELNLNEKNLLEFSGLEKLDNLPDAVEQEELLDSKKREREKLGSVNLRADEETAKYEVEIKKMEQDRQDLVTAIIKLKESINELNKKGRERLLEAFEKVNRKFNEVYTKLFNGGNAKLELVDSDDPLEAGLELLVSPPGKRLQSITLLSGGEQALTALSLIFAVFLTNPSPICVLDEVDAPLDDANVSRFCNLLDELTKITSTHFIIVTHHALTMSKMDRLYGITMPEKGISQLVAVDLQRAESMVA